MVGGNKVGSWASNGGTDDMKGVVNVSTEGRLTQTVAAKEVVTKGVEGGMATRAGETHKLMGKAAREGRVCVARLRSRRGEEVLGVSVGEGAKGKTGGDVGEGGKVGDHVRGHGGGGQGGGELVAVRSVVVSWCRLLSCTEVIRTGREQLASGGRWK